MTIRTTTIRPGYVVIMRTGITGNVKYSKTILEADTEDADGSLKGRWETERVIANAAELKEATQLRSKMRATVTKTCAPISFGLLCPEDNYAALNQSVDEARALADEFNRRAATTRLSFEVVAGKIESDDVKAVRAINAEVRELLAAMEAGISKFDPKAIRDAADRARELGSMLSPEMAERVKDAIKVARSAATTIKKAGEQSAAEIDLLSIQKITAARTSFLDLDEATEVAAPIHEGRMLDLAPIEMEEVPAYENDIIRDSDGVPVTDAPEIDLGESLAPAAPAVQVPQFEMD
ncbi:hypothetical protein [Bradyrhizobium erythrophlei]|uniref:Uncharacterized protein n=1 Tax=Bradyrhizobium erythrophlei TaxID=1437360 RepID=A0A1M5NF68_9BRAD|nr:hypothetical protein [Bradyrhizobium erythrophlei]SHG88161.1 hypothetical protein SAMN05443248_2971 [Bradyrhizobium erythrophlei]